MLLVQLSQVNLDKGYIFNEFPPEESRFSTIGELFKFCLAEYGRCASKVYIDKRSDESIPVGWVFQRRVKYDDCNELFLQETWITVHERMPETRYVKHFQDLKAL